MFTLKVISGKHTEAGVSHVAGQPSAVFLSEQPLHHIFKNKFELVEHPQPIRSAARQPKEATEPYADIHEQVKQVDGKDKGPAEPGAEQEEVTRTTASDAPVARVPVAPVATRHAPPSRRRK